MHVAQRFSMEQKTTDDGDPHIQPIASISAEGSGSTAFSVVQN
jgi:hypothetical protein